MLAPAPVPSPGPAPGTDAFTREIVRNKLLAIAGEMGVVLARSSMSPIVYEVLDFACGLTDATGRVVAQDNGLCLFTGTFRPQVESILGKFPIAEMRPGDVFITNSPYGGGTHNSDIALIAPVFAGGRPIAFSISVTHWSEVGGKTLGSLSPDATEIFQEGLQLPQLRLARAGEIDQNIVDVIRANVRLPQMSLGDLNAGLAAGRIAEQRLTEVVARYGLETTLETFEAVLDHGEALARAALATIPVGVYRAEDVIDGDGITEDPISIRVTVTVSPEELVADFTGCAAQTAGAINCARGALLSACKTVFKAIIAPQAPSNEGFFRPFRLVAPEGTVFTATRPAPTGWYFEASAYATELVWKALAPILPERLSAGSYLSLSAYSIGGLYPGGDGGPGTRHYWVMTTPQDGGWGACHDQDGESGLIATTDGDTYNYPAEVIEAVFPLTLETYALNVEAGGGAGRFRGGFGTVRDYRIENPGGAQLLASIGRSITPPWGLFGGQPGTPNGYEVRRTSGEVLRGGRVTSLPLARGDLVRTFTGNGGGWGDPKERDPDLVRRDVADGYVTAEAAREVYGVEL
jgi:N-methylhydantoinase B